MFTRLKVLGRGVKRFGGRRLPGAGLGTSEMESTLRVSAPPALESKGAKEFPKRDMVCPRGGREEKRWSTPPTPAVLPGLASPPHSSPPPAPAPAGEPLPAAPAPRLTQSVRSGETVAGAWERAVRWGGAAPPGLPRDALALGAGNEEEAGGGSGGGAAAGTRASFSLGGGGGVPSGSIAPTSRAGEKFPARILPPRTQAAFSALHPPPPLR